MEQSLPLKYQKNHAIIINDIEHSLYYYFDYGERYKNINMEFQHSHPFHEIFILLSPSVSHLIEGIPYALEMGDILLLKPGILHRSEYISAPPSKRLVIQFWFPKSLFGMEEYYLPLLKIFENPVPIFRFSEGIRNELFALLDHIYTLSQNGTYTDHPEERLMIHSLFLQFLYLLKTNQKNNIFTQERTYNTANRKIYDIVYYIHNHYAEDLSLEFLANRFFLSPSYLSHQFKKVTGFTLVNYIQRTRVSKARDLLLSTTQSISGIALSCGFQSFSQFNRIFRQIYEQSPSAMRTGSTTGMQFSGASSKFPDAKV